MKFVFLFLLLAISFLSGEVIFRSKSYILNQENPSTEILDAKKQKRTLRKFEKIIDTEANSSKILEQESDIQNEQTSLEEFLNVFYIDKRKEKLFVHPKSVLDIKVVTNFPKNSSLYYGFEKGNLQPYEFPIRTFEGIESIYYSENKNDTSPKELKLFIDSQNPMIVDLELFGNSYTKKGKNIFALGTELEVSAFDADSGIKSIRLLSENGKLLARSDILFEQEKEHKARFRLSDPNIKQVFIEVEDNVSNVIRTEAIEIELDVTPPTIQIAVEPTLSELEEANGICPIGTILSAKAADSQTEVIEIEYRYPNQEWKKYKSRLILAKVGDYKIEFRAKDFFGNLSLPTYFECRVVEDYK